MFTIDLKKVMAVSQTEDEGAVVIQTDDQRKIEMGAESAEAASEFLNDFADQWEQAVGPLLRHGRHVFLSSAIYSIQVQGNDVYIYFRDYSVSFTRANAEQALELLAELTMRWQSAIGATASETETA